jgi:YidC/Oxa1 family membrane protein insertase
MAVVLTIGVIFLSNLLFPAPEPPPRQVAADSALVEGRVAPGEFDTEPGAGRDTANRTDVAAAVPDPDQGSGVDRVEEPAGLSELPADTVTVTTDLVRLQFSTRGASLMSAELLEYES